MKWNAYFRLMRMDKPVGILLLWFPVAFALWTANRGFPSIELFMYFFLGTVIMRSAGCVVNDLADRHVDLHVRRTARRPVTTGEISVYHALILFTVLLLLACFIAIQLPLNCIYFAILGAAVTIIYPFCKRWINVPQLVLGIAFSVSIPMVYIASLAKFDMNMMLLIFINILWVITYDTIYAMVDREDDLKLGVKSTAVLFGARDRLIIAILSIIMHVLWLPMAYLIEEKGLFYAGWIVGAIILMYQNYLIAERDPNDCFKAFHWSVMYGFNMWLILMIPYVVH